MSFTVRELPKAKLDKRGIFLWLHEHSPSGAAAWLNAYDSMIERLKREADSFGEALERQDCDFDVKQILFFKTRRGRVYRAVFCIEGQEVFILRVRGPGQAPISPRDLK
jgi:hypothetical protein